MKHTHCAKCKRRIPWGQPRDISEIREGSRVTRRTERCMDCAGWINTGVKDAAAKP